MYPLVPYDADVALNGWELYFLHDAPKTMENGDETQTESQFTARDTACWWAYW